MSIRSRNVMLFSFLGFVLVSAGVLAAKWAVWWLAPVYWLNHYQMFHIVAHSGIFAGVVILYGPQPSNTTRMWLVVLSGAVLLELVQFTIRDFPFTRAVLIDTAFDIVVDVAGAAVCWCVITQRRQREALSPSSKRLLKS